MNDHVEGGCQCGRIRYRVKIDDDEAYLCHCRMCQRATGGVSIAFKNIAKADLAWSREPDWYHSSAIGRRPYCAHCRTPLGFEYPDSDFADLTVGSFDEPGRFKPTNHFGAEAIHEAWLDTVDLPRYRTDESEVLVKRWKEQVGKLPD